MIAELAIAVHPGQMAQLLSHFVTHTNVNIALDWHKVVLHNNGTQIYSMSQLSLIRYFQCTFHAESERDTVLVLLNIVLATRLDTLTIMIIMLGACAQAVRYSVCVCVCVFII